MSSFGIEGLEVSGANAFVQALVGEKRQPSCIVAESRRGALLFMLKDYLPAPQAEADATANIEADVSRGNLQTDALDASWPATWR